MVDWTAAKLKALGAQVELADLGEQTLHDGQKIPLPKAILAQLGNVSVDIIKEITNEKNTLSWINLEKKNDEPINQIDIQEALLFFQQ